MRQRELIAFIKAWQAGRIMWIDLEHHMMRYVDQKRSSSHPRRLEPEIKQSGRKRRYDPFLRGAVAKSKSMMQKLKDNRATREDIMSAVSRGLITREEAEARIVALK